MDDSINQNNFDSYRKVFAGRKNPNDCPIRGTFFVAHEYTNYQMVQQLHYDGKFSLLVVIFLNAQKLKSSI